MDFFNRQSGSSKPDTPTRPNWPNAPEPVPIPLGTIAKVAAIESVEEANQRQEGSVAFLPTLVIGLGETGAEVLNQLAHKPAFAQYIPHVAFMWVGEYSYPTLNREIINDPIVIHDNNLHQSQTLS